MGECNNDVVFEILTRVPLQNLGKCRFVSREWNLITNEPRFTHLHPLRTPTISGYILQSLCKYIYNYYFTHTFIPSSSHTTRDDDSQLSLNFLPHDPSFIKIEACQNGIVFCMAAPDFSRYQKYYVCKPTTKEWIKIPNPKTRYMSDKVAMVVTRLNPNLHYKILRVSSKWDNRAHHSVGLVYICEMFDSEVGRWKRLKDMVLPVNYDGFDLSAPVVVGGVAYWNNMKSDTMYMFDMYEETWKMWPLVIPEDEEEKKKYRWKRLTLHDGRLGLLCKSLAGDLYDIWVWEKTHNEWSMKHRVTHFDLPLYCGARNAFYICSDYEPCNF